MFKCLLLSVFLMAAPSLSENVFRINISPQEAQQYLQQNNLNNIPAYAPKTGENPLPAVRNANGEFIYQGRKIENPADYVEEHYTANQYHGQDGLGQYTFGYTDWNQGRAEAKDSNGVIQGTYKYVNPNGRDFVVNYRADHLGFHHEDNRPKVELKPATETPEVAAARAEHFRKWSEAAAAAGANPDPYAEEYKARYNTYNGEGEYHSDGSESTYNHIEPKYVPTAEEATAEPKGFFYSFDYSVPLLRNLKERQETEALRALNRNTRSLKDAEQTADEQAAKDDVVKQQLLRVDAVHDAQVPITKSA